MILLQIVNLYHKFSFCFFLNQRIFLDCSSNELKQFDRLYECHSNYEIFLTEQYKKLWEHLWAKQKTYQKHLSDLQTTVRIFVFVN
jgi:hypothetical protein